MYIFSTDSRNANVAMTSELYLGFKENLRFYLLTYHSSNFSSFNTSLAQRNDTCILSYLQCRLQCVCLRSQVATFPKVLFLVNKHCK